MGPLLTLAGSLLFVLGSVFLMVSPGGRGGVRGNAVAALLLFGLGVVMSLLRSLPATTSLTISDEGLTVRWLGLRVTVPWSDIRSVGTVQTLGATSLTGNHPRRLAFSFVRGRAPASVRPLHRLPDTLPFEVMLPNDFGMPGEALVELVEARRARSSG